MQARDHDPWRLEWTPAATADAADAGTAFADADADAASWPNTAADAAPAPAPRTLRRPPGRLLARAFRAC